MSDWALLLTLILAGPLLGLCAVWADGRLTVRRVVIATTAASILTWEVAALILLPGTVHAGLGVGRSFATAALYGVIDGIGSGVCFVAVRAVARRLSGERTA